MFYSFRTEYHIILYNLLLKILFVKFKSRLAHQQKSLKPQWFQGFFFCLEAILALQLALFLRQTLDEPLHTVSTAASHLFCHMTIDIQRKRCCVMTKVFLHCLDVIAAL